MGTLERGNAIIITIAIQCGAPQRDPAKPKPPIKPDILRAGFQALVATIAIMALLGKHPEIAILAAYMLKILQSEA